MGVGQSACAIVQAWWWCKICNLFVPKKIHKRKEGNRLKNVSDLNRISREAEGVLLISSMGGSFLEQPIFNIIM